MQYDEISQTYNDMLLFSHIFQLKQRTISILKLFGVKANRSSKSGCHGNWITVSLSTHQDRDGTSLSEIWAKEAEVNFFSGLTSLHKSLRAMCINLRAHVLIAVKLLIWKVSSQIHSITMTQSLVAFQNGLVFPQTRCFLNAVVCPISVSMVETHIDRQSR